MPPPLFRIQSSFAGGEFSPSMYSRVDIAKYLSGMRTGRNVNILPHGGVRNRPGTQYVASAFDSTHNVRLISFIASTSAAYVIELGQYYARFYLNDAQVQVGTVAAWVTSTAYVVGNYVSNGGTTYYCLIAHTSGTFATDLAAGKWVAMTALQIVTPWAGADLNSITLQQPLKFAQSADVMYFAHPSYAPQQLTFDGTTFSITPYNFVNGPFQLQNTAQSFTLTPSGINGTITKTISAVGYGLVPPIASSGNQNFDMALTFASAHGMLAGQSFVLSALTGAAISHGDLVNGSTYYVIPINTTSFFIGVTPSTKLLVGYPFNAYPTNGGYSPGAGIITFNGAITLTASQNLFQAGHVGALFQLTQTIVAQTITDAITANTYVGAAIPCGSTWAIITLGTWTGRIIIQVSIDNINWSNVQTLQGESTNYQTSGDTGYSQCYVRVVGDGATTVPPLSVGSAVTWSGTLTYDLTANSFDWNGIVQIVTVSSAVSATANVVTSTQNAWPLADTNATYQWSEGSWSTLRGWPTCVTFFQDRLCWASTKTEPATMWASKTASYLDFGVSSPVVASDSLSVVLPSRQLNSVSSLTTMPQFLVATTSDSEWGIGPGQDGTFSPTSISVQLQGHRGSAGIDPAVVGVEILLMQQMGTVLRNLIYQLAVSGFMGDNISIISQHLFTGFKIVQMAYQQEPDSIVWMVRSDGQLISLTYLREQEVAAFTHHDTVGSFESVCCVPNQTLGINEIWFSTVRTVGGQTVRFIERLMPRDQGTVPANQFFVDCGLTYNGAPANVISGLSYLAGMTVAILADGNVQPQQVVSNTGTITLANGLLASIVTIGLPYVSDVETLDIEAPDNKGTLQGRRVTISRATLRFWNSRGGYIGPKAPADQGTGGLWPVLQREVTDAISQPIALKTQDYLCDIDGGYDFESRLFFRQVDPLPFTITGIINQVVAGEN